MSLSELRRARLELASGVAGLAYPTHRSTRAGSNELLDVLGVEPALQEARHRITHRRLAHYSHALQGFLPGARVSVYAAVNRRRGEDYERATG